MHKKKLFVQKWQAYVKNLTGLTTGMTEYCLWKYTVVTLSTNSFNIRKFYVLPTEYMFVVWRMSEQTGVVSLSNINWLVLITETGCVYCAVGTESLNIIKVNISP
jgi:hypothetical protein